MTLWSRRPAERLRRQFARAGVKRIVGVRQAQDYLGPIIMVRADAIIDHALIAVLKKRLNFLLIGKGPRGRIPLAAHVRGDQAIDIAEVLLGKRPVTPDLLLLERRPEELEPNDWRTPRKRKTPTAVQVTEANRAALEWRMVFDALKSAALVGNVFSALGRYRSQGR
ncbi:hypothetical protein BH10PSE7_BH10PSE7_20590 [soil metagenome]